MACIRTQQIVYLNFVDIMYEIQYTSGDRGRWYNNGYPNYEAMYGNVLEYVDSSVDIDAGIRSEYNTEKLFNQYGSGWLLKYGLI